MASPVATTLMAAMIRRDWPSDRRSGAPIERIVLYPGDRLLNESKIVVKHFLGSRTSIDRASTIRRRHDHPCGHEGAGHIGGVLGGGHKRWLRNRFQLVDVCL